MINRIEVKNAANGIGLTGYTVRAYNHSTGTSGYSGSVVYTLTDGDNGVYYANVTETFKATIVVTNSGSTIVTVPTHLVGIVLWGDNILTITPGGTTP